MKLSYRIHSIFAAAGLCASLCLFSCAEPSYESSSDATSSDFTEYERLSIAAVNATLDSDFMRGFDASMISALEEDGVSYYNENNKREDPLSILKSNGVNWIRLRIWNNPTGAEDESEGDNDLARTLKMAKRVKNLGLKLLLDFHYSDEWADPTTQVVPSAWQSITTADEMSAAITSYTTKVLTTLQNANALPDMVQIGNEIDSGMLYGTKSTNTTDPSGSKSGSNFITYLKAAAAAVDSVDSEIKIMIHRSRGGQQTDTVDFFTALAEVDYDVAGLSYYPFFESHGTIKELKENIDSLINDLGKEVVIAETSFAWTCDWDEDKCDNKNNQLWYNIEGGSSTASLATAATNLESVLTDSSGNTLITTSKYNSSGESDESYGTLCVDPTYQNQAAVIRAIYEAAASAGASGVFYWGGDWVCSGGTILSTMENQALFDYDHKVLPGMAVFAVQGN